MMFIRMKIRQFYWKIYRILLRKSDPFPHLQYARKHKFIFIHIPKTAGTSILNALEIKFRHHSNWSVYEAADPKLFRHCYKFCFVRNPYDRIVSVYTYLKGGGAGYVDKEFHKLIVEQYDTFEKFVLEYLNKDVIHEHHLLIPQYLYIYGFNNTCKVDYIGRFENLNNDFSKIAERLSLDIELPKMNASKRKIYQEYYTQQIQEKIHYLYNKDFLILNYNEKITIDN